MLKTKIKAALLAVMSFALFFCAATSAAFAVTVVNADESMIENVAVFEKKELINADEYAGRTNIPDYRISGNWTYDGSELYDAVTVIDGEQYVQYIDTLGGAAVYKEKSGEAFVYENSRKVYFCNGDKVEKRDDGKYYSIKTGEEIAAENLTLLDENRYIALKNPVIIYSTNNRSTVTPIRGHNPAVAFRAPRSGKVTVNSLVLNNEGNKAVIKYCLLLYKNGAYYGIGGESLWTTVASGEVAELNTAEKYALSAGDELLIVVSTDENRKERVKLNLSLSFAGTEYSIDQSAKLVEQGEKNFRFYEVDLAEKTQDIFNAESAKEFGKLNENDMPWDKSSGGWKLQQEVIVSPRPTNMKDGKVNEFRFHTYSVGGKYVTYAFTSKQDCSAFISKFYLAKSAWNTETTVTAGNDGISWGLAYYSAEKKAYYTVTNEKWHYFNSTQDKDGLLVKTDFPRVDMKAGDKLLFVFSSNENKIIDYINGSYVELYTQSQTGEITRRNMVDDFVFVTEGSGSETTIVALDEERTRGDWAIEYVNMSGDYSAYEVGAAVDADYNSVSEVSEYDTNFNSVSKTYYSADNVDARLAYTENGVAITPGEDMSSAIKLNIKGAGRVKIHPDSYIKFNNDGTSDGVRFRIMKNDQVVFPSSGEWFGIRDKKTFYLDSVDVFSVDEGDDLYFVFDCVGNTVCDEAIVDFIVVYAADGEANTETYQLSGNIPAHEKTTESLQGLNGWSFVSLEISGDINTREFAADKKGGCKGDANGVLYAVLICGLAAVIVKKRAKR